MNDGSKDKATCEHVEIAERRKIMKFVYDEHHPKLLNFVRRRVSPSEEVSDVCQEIWRSFFIKFDEFYNQYDDLAMVLYQIAKCRVADFWRHHERRREVFISDDESAVISIESHECISQIEGVDCRVDLQRAMACLTSRQREALCLHYTDRLTVAQTAVLMGVSDNTVKKHLKSALIQLRKTTSLDSYRSANMPQEGLK